MSSPLRAHLAQSPGWGDPHFRWRSGDVSRLEGLSDAAFGVALALLIVSSSVPETYSDLWRTVCQLPAFAVCFLFLMIPWYAHYKFFRRFGLQDMWTTTLNGALLFVVLFYVYPLKFLFTTLVDSWFGLASRDEINARISGSDSLMTVYGSGVIALFGLLAMMNWHALRKRDRFELSTVEVFLTRAEIRYHLIYVVVAMASVGMAVAGIDGMWCGLIYTLYWPLHFANGWLTGSAVERLVAEAGGEAT